ncbi:MAG: hypothetical protein ACXU9B_03175 [Reyranella sp.]
MLLEGDVIDYLELSVRVDEARRALKAAERSAGRRSDDFTRQNLASARARYDLCVTRLTAEQEPNFSDLTWMLDILATRAQSVPAEVAERLTSLDLVESRRGRLEVSAVGRIWLAEKGFPPPPNEVMAGVDDSAPGGRATLAKAPGA